MILCKVARAALFVGLAIVVASSASAADGADRAGETRIQNASMRGAGLDATLLARALRRAADLRRLRALIVARHGRPLVEKAFRGPGLNTPVNVKSVSKSIVSALVGIAIARGMLDGPAQPVAPLFRRDVPQDADPRLRRLTIGHLLSMQAGLERTSGWNYGRWVASPNWVRHALTRPFIDEPGGRMLYSTGNTHLVSAILTRAARRSTLDLARDWLGRPLEFRVPPWQRDPQGIYLGGNNMLLTPRALLRFGEMYRNGGVFRGRRVVPESWIRASWTPRTRSPFSGDLYGYGWFITEMCGRTAYYARGYGGQKIYIVPTLALTVVITSDTSAPSWQGGYRDAIRDMVANGFIRAAERADGARAGGTEDETTCLL